MTENKAIPCHNVIKHQVAHVEVKTKHMNFGVTEYESFTYRQTCILVVHECFCGCIPGFEARNPSKTPFYAFLTLPVTSKHTKFYR